MLPGGATTYPYSVHVDTVACSFNVHINLPRQQVVVHGATDVPEQRVTKLVVVVRFPRGCLHQPAVQQHRG